MKIINPTEMREISISLAEQLAFQSINTSVNDNCESYCAAIFVDDKMIPLRPLMLTGLKQATECHDKGARFWVSNSGKLFSLDDSEICAVNYFHSNNSCYLNIKPNPPLEIPSELFTPIKSQANFWGQPKWIPINEVVSAGLNGHQKIIELNNGLHLVTPNQHAIASWDNLQVSAAKSNTVTNLIVADLDKNKFIFVSRLAEIEANPFQRVEPIIEQQFDSITEFFVLAREASIEIPDYVKNIQFESVKLVSLKHGNILHKTSLKTMAALWGNIEIFRLKSKSKIMSPVRCDDFLKLIYATLNFFQSLQIDKSGKFAIHLRHSLESIPNAISDCMELIKTMSLFEDENNNRLDALINRFFGATPGLIRVLSEALEYEQDHYRHSSEGHYGLQV